MKKLFRRFALKKITRINIYDKLYDYYAAMPSNPDGMCFRLSKELPARLKPDLLSNSMDYFPELKSLKPKETYNKNYWFPLDAEGAKKRAALLNIAILKFL